MKQNLRRILLCAALAGLPFIQMKAYDWFPVGDAVDANGFATTGGLYSGGDYIGVDAPNTGLHNKAPIDATVDPVLNVYGTLYNPDLNTSVGNPCSLKINGNVVLDATNASMTININEDVVFEPYLEQPTGGPNDAPCSQIYFHTSCGNTITINVDNNLTFQGKTTDTSNKDLVLTFAGRGTVIFNMANGTTVKFDGQIDSTGAQVLLDPETLEYSNCPSPSANAGGVKAFVLMDQTNDDVRNGRNKVLFQRQQPNYNESQRVLIEVGPNSVFTYLSTNLTGLPAEEFGDGYGAVAFDPSNNGTGRMILAIRGAYLVDTAEFLPGETEVPVPNPFFNKPIEKYPFNDGAVVVCGHYVSNFDPSTISGCVLPNEGEGFEPGYDFSTPAGIRAIMRVVDNQLFNQLGEPYDPSISQRRGLLVVNDVVNHGKLASDPYWDLYAPQGAGFFGVEWANSNPANALFNTRRGYVLGVNGQLDIYHNTFMDHASGAANMCDPLAICDYGLLEFNGDPGFIKSRNPSAFIVDGLDVALFQNGNPFILDDSYQPVSSAFDAANPYLQARPSNAEVLLRGSGTLYLKHAGTSKCGYFSNLAAFAEGSVDDALNNVNLNWTNALSLGTATYDGFQLAATEQSKQSGEGEHVLDVEGQLKVRSVANNTAFRPDLNCNSPVQRNYTNLVQNSGVVNATSILRDYTGREVFSGDDDLISRPLLADGSLYARYNSPTMFFNNFASFCDSILRHSDATKFVDGIPLNSEPGITGGERLWFGTAYWGDDEANRIADPDRFRFPEIQFFNSIFELQESLNASGVRFVVKDLPDVNARNGDNTSVIKFFDHGDPLDSNLTGYGRIFMCGSSLNLMCDGGNNFVTESCFFNVFKHNAPQPGEHSLDNSSRVFLSLANGDQFHPDIQQLITNNGGKADKFRAHHLFLFAQPPALDFLQPGGYEPTCNMVVGWSNNTKIQATAGGTDAPAGDSGFFPGSFPYPTEPLITDTDFFQSNPFNLDALRVPAAVVSVDGSILCFGSFDKDGNSIAVPVSNDNNSGVVYVKHGGRITASRPTSGNPIPGSGERDSIPFQCVFATMLAQRVWNDYNFDGNTRVIQLSGIIDLPHDQVTFDKNFGVQPYNITREMFAARRSETDGYVRLSFENTERDRTLALGNRSGAEEVVIGWFDRELADPTVTFEGTAGNQLPKNKAAVSDMMKWLTRATESNDTPAARPTDLLYVGPGDDVVQMKVAGATMSDPFALDISGDGVRPVVARVREFVSLKSTRNQVADTFISEGAHAVLFTEFGGRIGLGSRAWNEHSLNAWNILGKDYVTICPLGDGVVDLNANLIVADRQALLPTTKFGNDADFDMHRLTFISTEPYEIRIPSNGELDLSGFGRGQFLQQISFGGQVRLVFEEGATLRLPDNPNAGLVLYFNDASQLIFEGAKEPSTFLPFTDAKNNLNAGSNTAPSANSRIRILGQGQIWLNKDAQMHVNGNTFVGVETDELSPTTDVTISIQRQGEMFVGTETLSGGAFQVGNTVNRQGHSINFSLLLGGARSTLHIDREGFLGLGAGIINKDGAPNGNASSGNNPIVIGGVAATTVVSGVTVPVFNPDVDPTSGEWQVHSLFNVNDIVVQNDQGIIEHRNIFDGSTSQASLMAVGSANRFIWRQGNQDVALVRGGGNVMFVPTTATAASPVFVNIWDYAGPLAGGEQYSILSSGQGLIDRKADVAFVDYPAGGSPGKAFTFTSPLPFFSFLSYKPFNTQGMAGTTKRVDLGTTQFISRMGFTTQASVKYPAPLTGSEIIRLPAPATIGTTALADGLNLGALGAVGDGTPSNFVVTQ